MNEKYIQEHLISHVYKILCWREEDKNWERLYDELVVDLSMNNSYLNDDLCQAILFKVAPLKFLDEDYFKQRIFEVINYLNGLTKLSQ